MKKLVFLLLFALFANFSSKSHDTVLLNPKLFDFLQDGYFDRIEDKKEVKVGDVTLKFTKVKKSQYWSFDEYPSGSYGLDAERDEAYIIAKVLISSQSKYPELPPISVYYMSGDSLMLLGTMGYRFASWSSYGSYLGNYSDYGNDFAHTETIAFSCGLTVDSNIADNATIIVVVKNTNCFYRNHQEFKTPEIRYTQGDKCSVKSILSVEDFEQDYIVVKTLNKKKER